MTAPAVATGRWTRLRTPIMVGAAAAAACVAVAVHDPNQSGAWLVCPFLATTGFYCVGCGTLRSLHALLHGDPSRAWAMNPGFLLTLPVLAAMWVFTLRRAWRGVPQRWEPGPIVLGAIPVVVVLYWVLRNVPGFEFLGPIR